MDATAQLQGPQGFFGKLLQDNPLALGIIALALGALVGLLLPESRQEHVLLGPKRDQLADQAQAKVKEVTQKATAIAMKAQDAVHDVVDKTQEAAKDAISDAVQSVKEEAEHQGLPIGA